MNSENKHTSISGISVLMVFLIMCISIFAMLTLSTAQTEWNLTRKNEEQLNIYYTCDGLAQKQLSNLDSLIKDKTTYSELKKALKDTEYSISMENGRPLISYKTVPYYNRQIQVSVAVNNDGSTNVTKYRLVNVEEFNYDIDLDVFKPKE